MSIVGEMYESGLWRLGAKLIPLLESLNTDESRALLASTEFRQMFGDQLDRSRYGPLWLMEDGRFGRRNPSTGVVTTPEDAGVRRFD